MLLLGTKTDEARKKADMILEKFPDDVEALGLLAGVQVQEKDSRAASRRSKRRLP